MDFACPNSGYIAGIRSQHSNEREDRVFRFKCCSVPGTIYVVTGFLKSYLVEFNC